ncbi:unnamed protein product [Ectocarpus sp. 6 AP-2014]
MKKKPCGEALRRRGVKHSNGINIDLLRQMLVKRVRDLEQIKALGLSLAEGLEKIREDAASP